MRSKNEVLEQLESLNEQLQKDKTMWEKYKNNDEEKENFFYTALSITNQKILTLRWVLGEF